MALEKDPVLAFRSIALFIGEGVDDCEFPWPGLGLRVAILLGIY